MKKLELTLAKTLELIAKADDELKEITIVIDGLANKHKFRGERVYEMDINRICYQLGIVDSMFKVYNESIEEMDDDYTVSAKTIMYAVYDKPSLEAIEAMRSLIPVKLSYMDTKTRRDTLQNFATYFSDEDYKALHKGESLEALKRLGIVQ